MADLLLDTKQLLAASVEPFEDIAKGAGVGLSWLYMFARGEIANPGVVHVQRLYDYLVSRLEAPSSTARPQSALSA